MFNRVLKIHLNLQYLNYIISIIHLQYLNLFKSTINLFVLEKSVLKLIMYKIYSENNLLKVIKLND